MNRGDHCEISERCNTHVDRAIWDGNQLLYDIRWDGISDSSSPGTGDDRGRIVYVHGGGIDQPLGLVRNGTAAVLHHDYRGLPVSATDEDGATPTCGPGESSGCLDVRWPGGTWIATLGAKYSLATPDWYGALSVAQRDDTGNLYRRNRYYDPASGQFTQADPISIAGGMNVYGFGNGDPVNFSDPFGLYACPPCEDGETPEPLTGGSIFGAIGGGPLFRGIGVARGAVARFLGNSAGGVVDLGLRVPRTRKASQMVARFRSATGSGGGLDDFLGYARGLAEEAFQNGDVVTGTVGRGAGALENATIFRRGDDFLVTQEGVIRSFVPRAGPGGIRDEFLRLGGGG